MNGHAPSPTLGDLELVVHPGSGDSHALVSHALSLTWPPLNEGVLHPGLAKLVSRLQLYAPDGEELIGDEREARLNEGTVEQFRVHVYKLHQGGGDAEYLESDNGDAAAETHAARHWVLPCTEFDGLWDSLVYDDDVKGELLRYAQMTLLLADRKVNPNIVSWNKVLLLHGPPGTGKTSLCSAFAQKLAVRMGSRFRYGQLIEINSHSLFSKWFSESGKLVQKMFETIQTMVDDPKSLVCVLIDEVESLTAARSGGSNEPSDAIRVVNAVLTQLDSLRKNPNVLILTTSNITGTIDLAFVDRADLKKYIGLPGTKAVAKIIGGCVEEFAAKGLVVADPNLEARIKEVSIKCVGFSGRMLRKLPMLALCNGVAVPEFPMSGDEFLSRLEAAVAVHRKDRDLAAGSNTTDQKIKVEK